MFKERNSYLDTRASQTANMYAAQNHPPPPHYSMPFEPRLRAISPLSPSPEPRASDFDEQIVKKTVNGGSQQQRRKRQQRLARGNRVLMRQRKSVIDGPPVIIQHPIEPSGVRSPTTAKDVFISPGSQSQLLMNGTIVSSPATNMHTPSPSSHPIIRQQSPGPRTASINTGGGIDPEILMQMFGGMGSDLGSGVKMNHNERFFKDEMRDGKLAAREVSRASAHLAPAASKKRKQKDKVMEEPSESQAALQEVDAPLQRPWKKTYQQAFADHRQGSRSSTSAPKRQKRVTQITNGKASSTIVSDQSPSVAGNRFGYTISEDCTKLSLQRKLNFRALGCYQSPVPSFLLWIHPPKTKSTRPRSNDDLGWGEIDVDETRPDDRNTARSKRGILYEEEISHAKAKNYAVEVRELPVNGGIRQAPSPVNDLLIPSGAITTPPDSSDDDDEEEEERGRSIGNLRELQEALQQINVKRDPSPTREPTLRDLREHRMSGYYR